MARATSGLRMEEDSPGASRAEGVRPGRSFASVVRRPPHCSELVGHSSRPESAFDPVGIVDRTRKCLERGEVLEGSPHRRTSRDGTPWSGRMPPEKYASVRPSR